ncbi:transcription termination factor, RNA polymerase II [Verticillium nonalfalfae]|uniref:Transcription termination factor, RNA polymerase II n=1 Tax=Verticillium nonalfalfae TaxID=1051616 RepID=A0A3M9YJ13_9PEZI|nr:transcription termination factor, RNA polymerase II [Verticillium nonalfalfae]RNJ59608.1 transcription termination factor, RNA polymerase II [Verticillium nonalfalfae]
MLSVSPMGDCNFLILISISARRRNAPLAPTHLTKKKHHPGPPVSKKSSIGAHDQDMDTILPLLKTIARSRPKSTKTPERRPSRDKSHGDKQQQQQQQRQHNGELEVLLFLLAHKGMEYAAKRYLASEHGTKRREEGQPAVDGDALERLGRVVLAKIMGAKDEGRTAGGGVRRRHRDDGNDRDGNGKERNHKDGNDKHRNGMNGNDKHRHDKHRHDTGQRRHRDASSESRSRHRRQYGGHRGRDDDGGKHERHRRGQHEGDAHRRQRRRGPALEMEELRVRLEDMSEALIGMNERPAGRPGHEECAYYDLFVAASTPLQDAIGGVLGQMREVEGRKGRGRRRHGGEHKERRKKEVPEPEVSRGRTRRRQEHGR